MKQELKAGAEAGLATGGTLTSGEALTTGEALTSGEAGFAGSVGWGKEKLSLRILRAGDAWVNLESQFNKCRRALEAPGYRPETPTRLKALIMRADQCANWCSSDLDAEIFDGYYGRFVSLMERAQTLVEKYNKTYNK